MSHKGTSVNSGKHPYCRDNFQGSPEVQTALESIKSSGKTKHLVDPIDMPFFIGLRKALENHPNRSEYLKEWMKGYQEGYSTRKV